MSRLALVIVALALGGDRLLCRSKTIEAVAHPIRTATGRIWDRAERVHERRRLGQMSRSFSRMMTMRTKSTLRL